MPDAANDIGSGSSVVGWGAAGFPSGFTEVDGAGNVLCDIRFGDAAFSASAGGTPFDKPVVGKTATPDGAGYWLVASDDGDFSYGVAGFCWSAVASP